MKKIVVMIVAALIGSPAFADFEVKEGDKYQVESNIREVFDACLKQIENKERPRIELYTCINLGLAKVKEEMKTEEENK